MKKFSKSLYLGANVKYNWLTSKTYNKTVNIVISYFPNWGSFNTPSYVFDSFSINFYVSQKIKSYVV